MSLLNTNSILRTPCSSPLVLILVIIDPINPWLTTAADINNFLLPFMPLENNQFFKQFANPQPQINIANLLDIP